MNKTLSLCTIITALILLDASLPQNVSGYTHNNDDSQLVFSLNNEGVNPNPPAPDENSDSFERLTVFPDEVDLTNTNDKNSPSVAAPDKSEEESFYSANFYIFVVLGAAALLFIVVLIIVFIRQSSTGT